MLSKSRFVSAQFLAMLENGLWLKLAKSSNDKAMQIATNAQQKGYTIIQPVDGNQVFVDISPERQQILYDAGVKFYVFTSLAKNACRFVTTCNTTNTEIQSLADLL